MPAARDVADVSPPATASRVSFEVSRSRRARRQPRAHRSPSARASPMAGSDGRAPGAAAPPGVERSHRPPDDLAPVGVRRHRMPRTFSIAHAIWSGDGRAAPETTSLRGRRRRGGRFGRRPRPRASEPAPHTRPRGAGHERRAGRPEQAADWPAGRRRVAEQTMSDGSRSATRTGRQRRAGVPVSCSRYQRDAARRLRASGPRSPSSIGVTGWRLMAGCRSSGTSRRRRWRRGCRVKRQ